MQNRSKNQSQLEVFSTDLTQILRSPQNKKTFSFEVTLTEGCNWNCEYCFEGKDKITGKKHLLNKNPEVLIDSIKNVLDNQWFNETFDGANIDFWGGEPTLNLDLMKKIFDSFIDDDRVRFFIYTNGSRVNKLLPIIWDLKERTSRNSSKILIQVSYDGNPIHDIRRIDSKGSGTSKVAIEAMDLLFTHGFQFQIKSTIMPKDFMYLPYAWDDILFLQKRYGNMIGYAPTIDYYNVKFKDEYLNELEKGLLEISKREYEYFKEHDSFLLNWFQKSGKKQCGIGKSMCAIDIDGYVYLCHGCIYSGVNDDLTFSNIFNDNKLLEGIKKNYSTLKSFYYDEECESCVATTCIRCNYAKYLNSDKSSFLDKFYDYKSQPELCKYYKLIGKINRALQILIMEEK